MVDILVDRRILLVLFFFHDPATTEIYTLSLHDALPISRLADCLGLSGDLAARDRYDEVLRLAEGLGDVDRQDRKSTRLNSSHGYISYAVFCLKKKKKIKSTTIIRGDRT